MNPVNSSVVNGFEEFSSTFHVEGVPKYASPACLSDAKKALWTNRVPMHEPWPRVMKVDETINEKSDEPNKNVRHTDQYDNVTSPDGLKPIGKTEGTTDIPRGKFWRR